jgi:hypothetical protein
LAGRPGRDGVIDGTTDSRTIDRTTRLEGQAVEEPDQRLDVAIR